MEGELLKFLDFEIGNPTTKTFLRYLLSLVNISEFSHSP